MISIFSTGAHAHRSPLAYPALADLFAGHVSRVGNPEQADLYLFSHPLDVMDAPDALVLDWRARRRPVVLLSEEPFWDTIWGRRPLDREYLIETRLGPLPVIQLNHATSAIFRFDTIPYYLLTNHRFASAYGARFARNATVTPGDWQARFATYAADLTFMFERRPEPFHSRRWPDGDIVGLCAWRTALAETGIPGVVRRLGQSWQGGPSRFDLDNWHLDKITRLDGTTRLLAAFENTHQPHYITEKLFDAFACGALPLYFAAPRHRVHDLGLPAAAWVNLYDLDPTRAAAAIAAPDLTPDRFAAYAQAQAALAQRFGNPGAWVAERHRLQGALLAELAQVLDQPRAAA